MEPKPWHVEAYLSKPDPAHRIFVIFGPDTGLVRERADRLARHHLGRDFDPFQLVRLNAEALSDDPARLSDEVNQISMFGGDRVIRVTEASQAVVTRAGTALFEGPPPASVVIFEANDLKPANALRKLAAKSPMAAVLVCYPDGDQDLDRLAGDALREAGLSIEPDARAAIVDRLGPDRQSNRQMLDTLITYRLGQSGPITLADVEAVMGDQSEVGFDAIAFATFEGKTAQALSLFDKSVAEKTDPEMIMSSLFRHLDRFDTVIGFEQSGKGLEIGMKTARLGPKDRQASFRRQLAQWPLGKLATARKLALDAQIEMRSSGSDSGLICRNLLLRLGNAANARPARR
ncbi:DNA polymerase III subunit delta [Minwuia sp.]|uniref:DNA polymerase III subunit delta n=1 Tax=Minwuia sp. TaxID=2493630 RepID=UPI003A94796A